MLAKKIKLMLPLFAFGAFAIIVYLLFLTKPEPSRRPSPPSAQIAVELLKLEPQNIQPRIQSYGLVEPRIRSKVVAQVSGRIEFVAEHFRDGGFFKKGAELLRLEPADYEIEVSVARANVADMERRLQEEIATAEQARQDWERLGQRGSPSPLVLREPQVKAAKANVESAKARLKKAELNLDRTRISAPFDGRVLNKNVDLGQVVNGNTVLGEIYATDAIEVRLPIKNNELELLELPERYSHEVGSRRSLPNVKLISRLSGVEEWRGKIVRTAGSIDSTSRQLNVVAHVFDPFGPKAEGRFPLKIGQYVNAEIAGKKLDQVISIPNRAIYQGSFVYQYRDGAVYRQEITIDWQNEEYSIVSEGLNTGDQIVLTPLGQIASGTEVRVAGAPGKGGNARGGAGSAKNNSTGATTDIAEFIANLPPERLERMKQRAEEEGKTLEEFVKTMRARRAGGGN